MSKILHDIASLVRPTRFGFQCGNNINSSISSEGASSTVLLLYLETDSCSAMGRKQGPSYNAVDNQEHQEPVKLPEKLLSEILDS